MDLILLWRICQFDRYRNTKLNQISISHNMHISLPVADQFCIWSCLHWSVLFKFHIHQYLLNDSIFFKEISKLLFLIKKVVDT